MNEQLIVFYDKSCPLCRTEVESLVNIDAGQRLKLVDCSAPHFDDSDYHQEGITQAQMLASLHIRTADGEWFKGVDSFGLMYKAVGLPLVSSFWSGKLTRPVTQRLYPYIAKNRYLLSKLGVVWCLQQAGKYYAWRANRNSQQCNNGLCELNVKNGGDDHAR